VSFFLSGLKVNGQSQKEAGHTLRPEITKTKPGKRKETQKEGKSKPTTRDRNDKANATKSKAAPVRAPQPTKAETAAASASAPTPLDPNVKAKKAKLVIPPTPLWHAALPPLSAPSSPLATPTPTQLSSLSARAHELLDADTAAYAASEHSTGGSAGDKRFLETLLKQGTLSDRLSALTLVVQGAPVHERRALEGLRGMMDRKGGKGRDGKGGGREEGLKAVRCVVDWWVGGGAPDRKLRYFRDQPLLHPDVTDAHLALWAYEDWLKKWFFDVLGVLETYSLDSLPYVRTQTLAFITTLLREKPEQEQNLLRLLVNKLVSSAFTALLHPFCTAVF